MGHGEVVVVPPFDWIALENQVPGPSSQLYRNWTTGRSDKAVPNVKSALV